MFIIILHYEDGPHKQAFIKEMEIKEMLSQNGTE